MRVEFLGIEAARASGGGLVAFGIENQGVALADQEVRAEVINALNVATLRNGFDGKREKVLCVAGVEGLSAACVSIVGLGSRPGITLSMIEEAAGRAFVSLADREFQRLEILMASFSAKEAAHAALGVSLSAYRFGKYHTVKKRKVLEHLVIVTSDPVAAAAAYQPLAALAEGIVFARDLTNEPPNLLYPTSFVERLQLLEAKGVEITVLGEAEMAKLGMGSLLAVGQGSARESQLVICKWLGAKYPQDPPVVFVGKGVTFDSGGLSIKPAKDMELMKQDMGGAAAVVGALLVLAERKAAANVIGVLGLVENMPDGQAVRPGDIVTSMSGQTIEIVNTDAEGRLVLADALWYAQREFHPRAMIDLATLTGHASYALGNDCASLLTNDDQLGGRIVEAGGRENEMFWRLPLIAAYDKLHDTLHADMKNVGGHPEAGAITAALFLQRFVNGQSWAHLDIASVIWRTREDRPTLPQGATGYGVRTLNRLVADYFEDGSDLGAAVPRDHLSR